jgi:hypothetical protein
MSSITVNATIKNFAISYLLLNDDFEPQNYKYFTERMQHAQQETTDNINPSGMMILMKSCANLGSNAILLGKTKMPSQLFAGLS